MENRSLDGLLLACLSEEAEFLQLPRHRRLNVGSRSPLATAQGEGRIIKLDQGTKQK